MRQTRKRKSCKRRNSRNKLRRGGNVLASAVVPFGLLALRKFLTSRKVKKTR